MSFRKFARFSSNWAQIRPSKKARLIRSPMRDNPLPSAEPNPEKSPIKLHLGDPSLGVLRPPETARNALQLIATIRKYFGKPFIFRDLINSDIYGSIHENYAFTAGMWEMREILADYVSREWSGKVSADQVMLTNGCQHSLQVKI